MSGISGEKRGRKKKNGKSSKKGASLKLPSEKPLEKLPGRTSFKSEGIVQGRHSFESTSSKRERAGKKATETAYAQEKALSKRQESVVIQ